MDVDSLAGDVDSVAGGLSFLEPLLERVLADSVPQQHGWLRVFGKYSTPDRTYWRSERKVLKTICFGGDFLTTSLCQSDVTAHLRTS